jgi:hypothetical protein
VFLLREIINPMELSGGNGSRGGHGMPIKSVLFLTLLSLLTACAPVPSMQAEVADEFSSQGLHLVTASGFAAAYIRPGADLPAYRTVNIATLELENIDISSTPMGGTLRRDWQITAERQTALRTAWSTAMSRFFGAYEMSSSGEKILRITSELTRIAPGRPSATTIGGGLQSAGSSRDVIEVSAEFRLYDQDTGSLLAVIRDSRTMTSVAISRTAGASVQTLFNSWAALLHTRVSGR